MEIIIIIIVIMVIMALIGGLGPTGLVYETNLTALETSQYTCDRIVWTTAPTVTNGQFRGRLSLACEVVGIGHGGIAALEEYLAERVVMKAAKFYGATYSVQEGSLRGATYDVAVRGEANGESIELRGTTQLLTDGAIELRHTFSTDPSEAQKANRWLRGVRSELHVSSTLRPNWYRVVISHEAAIAKPALLSANRFQTMVTEQLEAKMAEEAKNVLTSIANNL